MGKRPSHTTTGAIINDCGFQFRRITEFIFERNVNLFIGDWKYHSLTNM